MSHLPLKPHSQHYPYVTQRVLELIRTNQMPHVVSIDVEPKYGYAARLNYKNGAHRIIYGNDLGANSSSSHTLVNDKGHTKHILKTMDIKSPRGGEFLLPWWGKRIGHGGDSTDQATAYVDSELSYPIYVKPIDGSKGNHIFVVSSREELETVLEIYNKERVRVAVIEEPIAFPDYRIVMLDGQLHCAYLRKPITVTGDGTHTISELTSKLHEEFKHAGRNIRLDPSDERILRHLAQHNISTDTILAAGQSQSLLPIANLSTGGSVEDVTHLVHRKWRDLTADIAKGLNLRLIGLDIMCADITSADADYYVIEVNSSPGLEHFAASGRVQKELVDQLYIHILDTSPRI